MGGQASQYIEDVISGRQVAGHWAQQACQRHLDDLEHGAERGLVFDEDAAGKVLKFFTILKHSKGEWAGLPLLLEPWQQFLIWVLFGWKRSDGTRRFRTAYVETARKNGKSTLAAGIGLYLLSADGESGAEVYAAATKLDQAKIIWTEAARMARKSPMLSKRLEIFGDRNPKASVCNINLPANGSKFEPLGGDSTTQDGLNVHGALIDEVHAHKTGEIWDVIETATGARRQPLLFAVTTAGFDRHTLCWQLNEYAKKVLDGIVEDDSFFGLIYTLDAEDDWQDEQVWIKANPNLGVSKKLDQLREKAEKAKEIPSRQNAFKRLELNVWTQSDTKWLNPDVWRVCGDAVDEKKLAGQICYAGLDLSSNLDVTAFVMVFPPVNGSDVYQVIARMWIPDENMHKRVHDDRVPYDVWSSSGWLQATPGNVIDFDWIFNQIESDGKKFRISEIAFDAWGAARVVQVLKKMGMTCIEFPQGYRGMNEPMKALEQLLLKKQLAHGNNPVLAWMADNLVAVMDGKANMMPSKEKSRERIDGMVALLMGLQRAVLHNGSQNKSVYEEHGVRAF